MTDLVRRLDAIARQRCSTAEPAHDYLHVARVARTARALARAEDAHDDVAVCAALLHELFNHPKGHPEAHLSGEICAAHARDALRDEGVDDAFAERVAYAIRVHPFSRGIVPDTLEAKILQDADRLDAIGAIGIARCFATCSAMQRPFYADVDPFCRAREPDDKSWGVDHFYKKLLRVPDTLHTRAAKEMAARRVLLMRAYLAELEIDVAAAPD